MSQDQAESTDTGDQQGEQTYDIQAVQEKWLQRWEELQPFRADDDSPREKR